MKKVLTFVFSILAITCITACDSSTGATSTVTTSAVTTSTGADPAASESSRKAPYLTLIGHASIKIITSQGIVIYIDPYSPGDYSEKADFILVSHEHSDHNKISLCQQNEGCIVLRATDTINSNGSYNTFEYDSVKIEPVAASNGNHPISSTSGFLLTFDGITVYHASDTSKLAQMADLKSRNIDYAFFPIDGVYNMDAAEAMACATLIGARHNTPFHILEADVSAFMPANLLPLNYGETIELVP